MSTEEPANDVEVLQGIYDLCKGSVDGLAAWRAYRIKYGENHIEGRTAGDREKAFLGMYQAYVRYPAQFTMDLRQAKIRGFMRKLAEAFLSTEVLETEVEEWFRHLESAKHGSGGVKLALKELKEKRPELAEQLATEAGVLWPTSFSTAAETS